MFALAVVAILAVYFMNPEERRRLVNSGARLLRRAMDVAGTCRVRPDDPFAAELRARIHWPLVTYAFAAVNVAVFVAMMVHRDTLGDPATLVAWGGNFGPRTTDGERWRVFTSVFLHRGVLHLLVTVAALVQLGLVLERVAGPFTFGTVFIAAGVQGSIMNSAAAPLDISVGSNGAVAGLYGLLLACLLRGLLQASAIRIPLRVLKTLVPVLAAFTLYCLVAREPYVTLKVGLCTGFVGGILLTRRVQDYGVRLRRFAALGAATAAIVLMSAMALRAVSDVRPEIASLVTIEESTAAGYDAQIVRFRNGHVTPEDLAQYVDQAIIPALEGTRDRIDALVHVAPADAPLVGQAHDYLRLRQEAWKMRSEALRKHNMRKLRDSYKKEQESLQVFEKVKAGAPLPPAQPSTR